MIPIHEFYTNGPVGKQANAVYRILLTRVAAPVRRRWVLRSMIPRKF